MMKVYKNIFFIYFSLILFFIISVITLNYYVDPGYQFSQGRSIEEKIAKILLKQNDVVIHTNFNDRLMKKIIIRHLTTLPEILVLGSSRMMGLNENFFKNKKFYNAWLPHGVLQDDIAFYYLFQQRGWQPKTLIICLDSWLLARNNGQDAWQDLLPEYLNGKRILLNNKTQLDYLGITRGLFDRYSQLLSVGYLKSSFKKLANTEKSIADIAISTKNNICETCEIIHPDGSRTISQKQQNTSLAEVILKSQKDFPNLSHDNSYTELDPEYRDLFESFVRYLIAQNIHVVFYLPPYSPPAYAEIEKYSNYKMILASEKYFLEIANKYHITTLGAYDPKKIHLKTADFYDAIHLKQDVIEKVFDSNVVQNIFV